MAVDGLGVLSTILSSMSGLGSNYFLLPIEKHRRRSVEKILQFTFIKELGVDRTQV